MGLTRKRRAIPKITVRQQKARGSRRHTKAQNALAAMRMEPDIGWHAYLTDALLAPITERRRRYKQYTWSFRWRSTREAFFALAGRECAICGREDKLAVHHTHYATVGREGIADLRAVCEPCHETSHGHGRVQPIEMTARQREAWRQGGRRNDPLVPVEPAPIMEGRAVRRRAGPNPE